MSGRAFSWAGALCAAAAALLLVLGGDSEAPEHTSLRPPDTAGPSNTWSSPSIASRRERGATKTTTAGRRRRSSSPRSLRRTLTREQEVAGSVLRRRQRKPLAEARAFLAGYLAFEAGGGGRAIARMRSNATARLVRFIAARQPRLPAMLEEAPPAGRVAQLAGEFDKPPSTFRCRALIDRAGRFSELGLTVAQEGRRWIVTDVTE